MQPPKSKNEQARQKNRTCSFYIRFSEFLVNRTLSHIDKIRVVAAAFQFVHFFFRNIIHGFILLLVISLYGCLEI